MLFYASGSENETLNFSDLKTNLFRVLNDLGAKRKVIAIPPDFTRISSQAGIITQYLFEYYQENLTDVLPAIGTHLPMTRKEINHMFGNTPFQLFRTHRWRNDLALLGEVPGDYIYDISEGKLNFSWPVQINKILKEGNYDLIISLGQVVPHEVVGMANYSKNILIGVGGEENIHKSHFLGAMFGIERIMGEVDNPVRRLLNHASELYLGQLPILYILTVIGRDDSGKRVVRGLYIGDDDECFKRAAQLSRKVNFELLNFPQKKIVVFLDPQEFKSTWLGNKSIYRTRMAIADGGELIVLAPGISTFGEDPDIDRLIRKYGYRTTPEILDSVKNNSDLSENLAAAAHLIHGSSENRFNITYCPGQLSKAEIESVNFQYGGLSAMLQKYSPDNLNEGLNKMDDEEEIFFISNPAHGLWVSKEKITE